MLKSCPDDNSIMTHTILIIDDNPDFRETLIDILVDQGHDIYEAGCPKEGFDILFRERVDLIICDLNMPFTNDSSRSEFVSGSKVGVNTIKELGYAFPDLPIICISAEDSGVLARARREFGDVPLLRKPVSCKILLEEIDKALSHPYTTISQGDNIITH